MQEETSARLSLIYVVASIILVSLFIPIYSIECSNNNTCSIYLREGLLRSPKLINMFNKSDIEHSEIRKSYNFSTRKGGVPFCRDESSYYQIYIYLKQGETISLEGLDFNSLERAQEVYNNMINNNNFKLKGNIWKTICGRY